ncbi:MAG: PP0621 family protein [Methylotenera sp.]
MWRLIFLGLIVWLAVYIFKRHISQSGSQPDKRKPSEEKAAGDDSIESGEKIENMVQCAACKVHLPRSEAFLVDGNFYCCKAHIQNK